MIQKTTIFSHFFQRTTFFSKKNLNPEMFEDRINLSAPINEHSAWIFRHIYSKPYSQSKQTNSYKIERYYHGITHVNRAAIYVPIFANLYRKYNYEEALQLTNKDIKLLQITALFHDAAREGDEEDLWDDESGTMLYYYLMSLGIDEGELNEQKIILLAEAIANKDTHADGYHQLIIKNQKPTWIVVEQRPKNIYQKLIHDADCLDIIRARDHFDANYLDFYQDIASHGIANSFNEMAQLITEARSLITTHGDSRVESDPLLKIIYEAEKGFNRICNTLNNKNYYILPVLYHDGTLLTPNELTKSLLPSFTYDPQKGLEEENIKAAMYEGKLFARSIGLPSGIGTKQLKPLNDISCSHIMNESGYPITLHNKINTAKIDPAIVQTKCTPLKETLVALELRKMSRRKGVPTMSSKSNRDQKQGNPNRSISILHYGSGIFGNGFLIVNPNIEGFSSISAIDSDTGWKKKSSFNATLHTREEKDEKLNELLRHLKMGGSSRRYPNYDFPATHTELTYNIEDVDAIYYSPDPNFRNVIDTRKSRPFHKFSPFLQAIYLQNEYEKKYGKRLPIFEYSGSHHFIRKVDEKEYATDILINRWAVMCSDYMNTQLSSLTNLIEFAQQSILDIKVKAMYGVTQSHQISLVSQLKPGDDNYPVDIQNHISNAINEQKNNILKTQSEMTQILFDIASGDLDALIGRGEVNIVNNGWNQNPHFLMILTAIVSQQTKILQYLLTLPDKKLFLFAKSNKSAETALHYAVYYNNLEGLQNLLAAGADYNAPDVNGGTPLAACALCAVNSANINIINALLESGADVNALNRNGEPLLITAIKNNHHEMVNLLINKNANIDSVYYEDLSYILNNIEPLLKQDKKNELQTCVQSALTQNFVSEVTPTNNNSAKIRFTPLQLAVLLKSELEIKKLLEKGAVVSESTIGLSALDLATLMKEDRIKALLILYSPKILDEYITTKNMNFIYNLTSTDDIEKLVENSDYMARIYQYCTYYAEHVIDKYFEKTGKPVDFKGLTIDVLDLLRRPKFLDKILKGQAVGFIKDIYGRYQTKSTSFSTSCEDSYYFANKDLKEFNFDGWRINNFNLSGSTWRFYETDEIRFSNCRVDNIHIVPESNMRNVIFQNPIFSNNEQAEHFARYYPSIPAFLLNNAYIDILNKLISEGKKVDLSMDFVYDKIVDIIQNDDFELFKKVWSVVDDSQHKMLDKYKDKLIWSAIFHDNFKMLSFLLENEFDAGKILQNKHLFTLLFKLFREKFPTIEVDQALFAEIEIKLKKMTPSENLGWLYALTQNWIHLYTYLKINPINEEQAHDLYQLLNQLKSACFNYMNGKDVTNEVNKIKSQSAILQDKMEKECLLSNKIKEINLYSYFDVYVNGKCMELSNKKLTENDLINLCSYLQRNPQIKVLDISKNALTTTHLKLLLMVPTIKAIDLTHNQIDDEGAYLLAQSTSIKALSIKHNDLISLNGIKAIKSNLNFKEIFFSTKQITPEETNHWKVIKNEKNLFKRVNYGKEAGLNVPFPSLQNISFFAANQKAEKDKIYKDQLKSIKKSLIKR